MVDDVACLEIAKRNNPFVMSSPRAARTKTITMRFTPAVLLKTVVYENNEILQQMYDWKRFNGCRSESFGDTFDRLLSIAVIFLDDTIKRKVLSQKFIRNFIPNIHSGTLRNNTMKVLTLLFDCDHKTNQS